MLRIDVNSSRQLQDAVLAIRAAETTIQREYRQRLKALTDAAWNEAIRSRVSTRLQSRLLLQTARTAVSNQNVRLSVGTVGRPLSKRTGGKGAARPADLVRLEEFGGSPAYSTYKRTPKGKTTSHKVRRRVMTGYGPRTPKGEIVYPSLAELVPRVAAFITQTAVRTLHDAFEGKR